MIPALITWILRKYFLRKKDKTVNSKNSFRLRRPVLKSTVTLLMMFTGVGVFGQEQLLKYQVLYKGEKVGSVYIQQRIAGDRVHMKVTSKVRMRMLVSIDVLTIEESVFNSGQLQRSHVSRKVNGKERANRSTSLDGNIYQVCSEDKKTVGRRQKIDYNLHMMYFSEPEQATRVYSDNFQQFLSIEKISEHKYKIELPDGNFNYYFFKNGLCNKVEIHQSLYTLNLLLDENRMDIKTSYTNK